LSKVFVLQHFLLDMMKSSLFLTCVAYAEHSTFEQWVAAWQHIPTPALEANYLANLQMIDRQSKFHPGVTFGVNQFSGMSPDEFAAAYTMTPPNDEPLTDSVNATSSCTLDSRAPDRKRLTTTTVKHQKGQTCWAYSSMAHLEERVLAQTGVHLELAPKQLVDCTMWGCHGGYPFGALNNMARWRDKGIYTEASYPMPSKCQMDSCGSYSRGIPSGVVVSSPAQVGKSENCLINALLTGSVVLQVNTMPHTVYSWQQYEKGILTGPTDQTSTNHGVLAVGYYIGSHKHYFTIKNSWGSDWGEGGFIRIKMASGGVGPFSIFKDTLGEAQVSYNHAASGSESAIIV